MNRNEILQSALQAIINSSTAIEELFPNREFKREGNRWISPYKINGEKRSKPDKTVIKCPIPSVMEGGERSISLFDLYGYDNGINTYTPEGRTEVIERFCKVVGIPCNPDYSEAERKAYIAYKNRTETLSKMRAESLKETSPVYSYLTEVRGYSPEIAKAMSKDLAIGTEEELRKLGEITTTEDGKKKGGFKVGRVIIPFVTEGKTIGYTYRAIKEGDSMAKYINSTGLNSYNSLFLLNLPHYQTGKEQERVILTEGYFDALHAKAVGLRGVVGCNTNRVLKGQIEQLKRYRVKEVILAFDADAKGIEGTEESIRLLWAEGFSVKVLIYPQEWFNSIPDVKERDLDNVLKYVSKEEFLENLEYSVLGSRFLAYREVYKAQKIEGIDFSTRQYIDTEEYNSLKKEGKVTFTAEQRNKVRERLIELYLETPPVERIELEAEIAEFFEGELPFTSQQVENYRREKEERRVQEIKERKTEETFKEADKLRGEGKLEEAKEVLLTGLKEADNRASSLKFSKYSTGVTLKEFEEFEAQRGENSITIPLYFYPQNTLYTQKDNPQEQATLREAIPLELVKGAVTSIGAPTGHCKSRVLYNLALFISKYRLQGGESVLFLSVEENEMLVFPKLLNMYANVKLKEKFTYCDNEKQLKEYKRGIKWAVDEKQLETYNRKSKAFSSNYCENGKFILRSVEEFKAEEIFTLIRTVAQERNIKAIFIDFLQELTKNSSENRKEELSSIMKGLTVLASELHVPVVCAVQLNRTSVGSPTSMNNSSIADATEIEQNSNTILLCWNSAHPVTKNELAVWDKEAINYPIWGGIELGDNKNPNILFKVSKNRGGVPNMYGIEKINATTGNFIDGLREHSYTPEGNIVLTEPTNVFQTELEFTEEELNPELTPEEQEGEQENKLPL